jgi:quercetin dioxygenase-like cupin family protein
MDIRRFGPGHRRPDGPPGTRGVTGTVIHQDARGLVAELAFERHAVITPHDNPNTALFVVISGGGFVQVGHEGTRVNQGEAIVWPAGIAHGAYTDGSEMRAIVIEFSGGDDAWARGVVELAAGGPSDAPATPAEGTLTPPDPTPDQHDRSQGEPW